MFAHVAPRLNGIVWTGSRFFYVENTANTVWTAPAKGSPLTRFASMSKLVEETRCVLSSGTHGFPRGVLFCHSPDHKIYEIDATGKVRLFATLPAPYPPAGDGALAFDTVGRFGFRLVAATGRSGAAKPAGGSVFAVTAGGRVQRVGGYHGPGGADELAIAPASFGSAAGDALLTVDAGRRPGALVAFSPTGRSRVLARFSDGPNPIVVLDGMGRSRSGSPAPGLYLTDDTSQAVYYAADSQLARYRGDVLVGGEATARFWIVAPRGGGYTATPVHSNLEGKTRSLEAMIAVG